MKKIIIIMLSLTFAFSTVACRKEETATEATDKALTAIKNFDVVTVSKYFDIDDVDDDLNIDLDNDLEAIDEDDIKVMELFVKNFEYEIIDSMEEKNTAKVDVSITNTNMAKLFEEYFGYIFELIFTESDSDVLEQKLENQMIELLADEDVELTTTNLTLNLNKVDDIWKIDFDSTLADAMLGGLFSVVEDFEY